MEAVSKVLSVETTTVDGLDGLFESVNPDVLAVRGDSETTEELTVDSVVLWTLQEAAAYLGVSTRTVLRRLKNGSLSGRKVTGTNGPEWRIHPVDTEDMTETMTRPSVKTVTGQALSPADTAGDIPFQALLKVVESQAEQLKAASEVIIYQRSQLEHKDSQIKLLTDSQHKGAWWRRAWSWFAGR